MSDVIRLVLAALAGVLIIAVPGAVLQYLLRRRSVTTHIVVLLGVTVLAALAGIIAVAQGMFISGHDLRVLAIVLGISAVFSLAMGLWLGRRLGRDAMWADEVRARERSVEASRRELVAWVSHDLRTPLAGLRAMTEALEDGVVTDDATVADYHRRIRVETDRMTQLVDDLFELSRINAGALRLSLTNVPLADVVSDAIASAEPVATAKHIKLQAERGQWPTVRGSEPEIARIVANLLRNAIRYTPTDGSITVSGGRDDEGGWLAVTDACGGIPDEDLPRVFDVAFRGEAARTPRPGSDHDGAGGGLGLAIVRGLVEAQRGEVAVQNVGAGCRFLVRLPVV
jgi:signal transduction histidine kinase